MEKKNEREGSRGRIKVEVNFKIIFKSTWTRELSRMLCLYVQWVEIEKKIWIILYIYLWDNRWKKQAPILHLPLTFRLAQRWPGHCLRAWLQGRPDKHESLILRTNIISPLLFGKAKQLFLRIQLLSQVLPRFLVNVTESNANNRK